MENENIETIEKVISHYEEKLDWKRGGNLADRVDHCLSQFRQIADNSIFNSRNFIDDVKSQYKAVMIIMEGLTDQGLNHTHKRIIANHVISMLRSAVDKFDRFEYKYSTNNFERYDFFRSNSPERTLFEQHREMKHQLEYQKPLIEKLKALKEKYPEDFPEELPF